MLTERRPGTARGLVNKVPAVLLAFWIIKVLATTVGETAADWLANDVGLGLAGTTWVMSGLLVVVLAAQFGTTRYVPAVYWSAVVVISVVGTLVTDILTDDLDYGIAVGLRVVIAVAGQLILDDIQPAVVVQGLRRGTRPARQVVRREHIGEILRKRLVAQSAGDLFQRVPGRGGLFGSTTTPVRAYISPAKKTLISAMRKVNAMAAEKSASVFNTLPAAASTSVSSI